MQEVYIYMDDSGRMSHADRCCSYGGVYFKDRKARDNFKRQYVALIKNSRCHFCQQSSDSCDKHCPEVKSNTTNSKFRRRVCNLIKNSKDANSYATTIYNREIPKAVLDVKHSRGRRRDYYQKRVIKEILVRLINDKDINPYLPLKLYVYIDESPQSTNGIYDLKTSIIEELVYGICNNDYGKTFPPILFGTLDLVLKHVDSKTDYLVQASDFLVGYVNATLTWKPTRTILDFLDVQLYY